MAVCLVVVSECRMQIVFLNISSAVYQVRICTQNDRRCVVKEASFLKLDSFFIKSLKYA